MTLGTGINLYGRRVAVGSANTDSRLFYVISIMQAEGDCKLGKSREDRLKCFGLCEDTLCSVVYDASTDEVISKSIIEIDEMNCYGCSCLDQKSGYLDFAVMRYIHPMMENPKGFLHHCGIKIVRLDEKGLKLKVDPAFISARN